MNSRMGIWLIGLLYLSSGCATLLRGDSQKMRFQVDPAGATINVDGKDYTAPVTVDLKRKRSHDITVAATGYQSITFALKSQWDGASLASFVLPGGSVWFSIDTLSGADRSFNTLTTIKLNKAEGPSTQPITMHVHRGKVLNKAEYDKALREEREHRTRTPAP